MKWASGGADEANADLGGSGVGWLDEMVLAATCVAADATPIACPTQLEDDLWTDGRIPKAGLGEEVFPAGIRPASDYERFW